RLDIGRVEWHRAARGHAAPGLRGPLGPDVNSVGRFRGEPPAHAVPEAVPGGEHHHQHEDAPEHAERGQEGPQFVPAQRLVDLAPVIAIDEAHSFLSASTGRTAAARLAGTNPAAKPATISRTVASTATPRLTSGFRKYSLPGGRFFAASS